MPSLTPGVVANFNTLQRASRAGDLALLDCQDRATGQPVSVIAAIRWDGREYLITPLARLFDGDPYAELNSPNPEGGYRQT